ncbi:MAG: MFS transporter [Syntrophomonadaceae bacterium]|nr:MFS transporter [Syntrophomonadaceae bacterium]
MSLQDQGKAPAQVNAKDGATAVYSPTARRIVLVVTTMSAFITPFLASSINVALPSMAREFSLNAIMMSWVVTAYLLSATIFLVPFGRLADIYGRKKMYLWGNALVAVSALLAAFATSYSMLIFARILGGLASSMVFGTGTAILVSIYPLQQRGRVLGISVAGTYFGLSLGPLLGGWLTQYLGWRSIFLFIVPIGLITMALIHRTIKKDWSEARGERFDLLGALLYSAGIYMLMHGLAKLPAPIGFAVILGGFVTLVFFYIWESRTLHPVLNVKVFRHNLTFTFSNLAALINYSATFAVTFMLSLFLQYIKALTAVQAGYILVFQPVVMFLFSPFAGRLSDRIEPRLVASAGMGFCALGLALLIGIDRQTSLSYIITCLVLLGLGFALFTSPNTNAVMSSVDKRFYGVASGTLSTMRLTGQMMSMGIVTMIISLYVGSMQISPASFAHFLQANRVSFIVFALLCTLGVIASLARGKVHADTDTLS